MKKSISQIKQQVSETVKTLQKTMEQLDFKKVTNKINQVVELARKKIDNLNKINEIAITINNEEVQNQISQLEREIESLQKKINSQPSGLNMTKPQIDESEIEKYNEKLTDAKSKMSQLKQETNKTGTAQSKFSTFFNGLKTSLGGALWNISQIASKFITLPKITQKISSGIKSMGAGLKNGLKQVFSYASNLFSVSNIYSILSNSASTWLSSQNTQAQQLSANIEYMKYSMRKCLCTCY